MPWGGELAHEQTYGQAAYSSSLVYASATCSSVQVALTCTNGVLSAPAASNSCTALDPNWAYTTFMVDFDNTWNDLKGGVVGTVTNATLVAGKSGNGANFNGTTAKVVYAASTATQLGPGDFTVEAWVNPTTLARSNVIMGSNSWTTGTKAWLFNIDASNRISFRGTPAIGQSTDGTVYSPAQTWDAGTYYHVAVVRKSGVVSIYRNGAPLTVTASKAGLGGTNLDLGSSASGIRVGRGPNSAGYFAGNLDGLRISKVARYNGAFTPETTYPLQ